MTQIDPNEWAPRVHQWIRMTTGGDVAIIHEFRNKKRFWDTLIADEYSLVHTYNLQEEKFIFPKKQGFIGNNTYALGSHGHIKYFDLTNALEITSVINLE